MFQRFFGGSKFLKHMNTLMKIYSGSHNAEGTYRELIRLQPLIKNKGEKALYDLNRAALLYDMQRYKEASDVIIEIPSINPEFDARCADIKTKIMTVL